MTHRLGGVTVKASALRAEERGSIPGRVIDVKSFKNKANKKWWMKTFTFSTLPEKEDFRKNKKIQQK